MDRKRWRATGYLLIGAGVVLMLVGAGLIWMAPFDGSDATGDAGPGDVLDDPYADAGQVTALVGVVLIVAGIIPASAAKPGRG